MPILYSLQPAPQPMGCFEAGEHTPDNYGTINVDYNNYSVPEGLVGSSVLARVYSGHIAIYHQGRRVADHVRLEGKGGWSMQLEHYLGTFLRKPGALDSSTAMRQVPAELAELYRVHFCPGRQREFIRFMMYARDNGIMQSRITVAARSLRLKGVRHMTADHLKVELDSMLKTDVSENDADIIASVSCLDIHPRQQRTSIEEHAETTPDSLTAVLCRHPKLHAGNILN